MVVRASRLVQVVASLLVALSLLQIAGAATPQRADAATRSFACLAKHGLVKSNPADQLMAGWLSMDGRPRVWIGTSGNIDWSLDPYRDDAWRKHFLSLKWVESLAWHYAENGARAAAYLARAEAIVADFAAGNPPGGGPQPGAAWSAMYAGHRATAFACLDSLRPGVPTTVAAMGSTAAWLADGRNYPGDWNQGVEAMIGLLGLGCRLGREDWQDQAVGSLGRLATTTIDSDGAIAEQAPGYGSMLHRRLLVARDKIAECGHAPAPDLAERAAKLLDFLAWSTEPDGNILQLGDTEALPAPAHAGTTTEYTGSLGRKGTAPTGTSRLYPRGYLYARSAWSPFPDASMASLRFGPGRAFHGHNDHQSVTLYGHGKQILVDSGHNGYAPGAYRDFLRSPQAHNLLTIPELRFDPNADTALTRHRLGSDLVFAEVQDTAWTAKRTRSVAMDTTLPGLVVLDRASAPAPVTFEQLWHLPAGSTVKTYAASTAIATSPDGAVTTYLVQLPLAGQALPHRSTSVVTGRTSPSYQGWVSRGSGARVAAPVVVMRRTGSSAAMLTAVVAGPSSAPVKAFATRQTDGYYRVTLVSGGRTSVIYVSPGGTIRR